jgi:eukaryotic-like serine/threonine-protein kinase
MIGRTLGPYVIQSLLGSGGTGHVYAAHDRDLDRRVAVKLLRPELSDDPSLCERFRGEAENLARLAHPNITEFYALHTEVIADRQNLFLAMELVEGVTLETVIARCGKLGTRQCLAILHQAIAGLSYAHDLGMIHRDIKPSNLLLNESGVLKITDFGIARVESSQRLTRQGMIVGTLAYIAPEQIKGCGGDARSDIYSLGCVLYELLSGTQPFRGDNEYELIRAQIEDEPEPLTARVPALEPNVEQAVMRALAKQPEDRFASLAEFAEMLGTAALAQDAAAIVGDLVRSLAQPSAAVPVEDDATVQNRYDLRSPGARSVPTRDERIAVAPAAAAPQRRGAKPAIVVSAAAFAVVALACGGYIAEHMRHASAAAAVQADSGVSHDVAPTAVEPEPAPPAHASGPAAVVPAGEPPQQQAALPAAPPPPIAGPVSSYGEDGWPVIDGHVIRLNGVDALASDALKPVSEWVRAHGNFLECRPVAVDRYRCLTRQSFDLAQAILLNGGARTSADAEPAYREAEEQARQGKRGVWR